MRGIAPDTGIPALTQGGSVVIVAPLSAGPELSRRCEQMSGFPKVRNIRNILHAQRPAEQQSYT
ncbi:MAG: hypothetical protein CMI61_08805 [Parvibaculum sp.]|nr:hypothetical protein [Parvibaculum sp.]HCX67919.1 hypothetical protein [Rhodobiaceae bacterium]